MTADLKAVESLHGNVYLPQVVEFGIESVRMWHRVL